jgi:hypothetical protein
LELDVVVVDTTNQYGSCARQIVFTATHQAGESAKVLIVVIIITANYPNSRDDHNRFANTAHFPTVSITEFAEAFVSQKKPEDDMFSPNIITADMYRGGVSQNHSGGSPMGGVPPLPRGIDPSNPLNWSSNNPAPPPNSAHYLDEFGHRRELPIFTNPITSGPPVVLPATNPTSVVATDNKVHRPRKLPVTLVSSKLVVLDSRDRDIIADPSANKFKMRIPDVPQGIQSVELVEALIPVLAVPVDATVGSTPVEQYVVLCIDELQTAFTAQPVDPNSRNFNPVCQGSFAQFIMASELAGGDTYLHWSRTSGRRAIKTFPEPLDKLSQLTIRLWSRTSGSTPLLYPLPNETPAAPLSPLNNIFLRFEIISQK